MLILSDGFYVVCSASLELLMPATFRHISPVINELLSDTCCECQLACLHIANYTRPDIAFAVSYLARFVSLTRVTFERVVDVIKDLHGTADYGLYVGGKSPD